MTAKNVGRVFDEIACEWERYRKQPMNALTFFIPLLKKNSVVLDAGCGNARNAVVMARKTKFVYGVDASKKMLGFAEKRVAVLKNVELVCADFTNMPFENDFFDAAFYLASLHHLTLTKDRKKAFKEMARVLKKNGLVFLTVWNKLPTKRVVAWTKKSGEKIMRPHYFFEEKELRALAEENGFVVKKVFFEKQGRVVEEKEALNLCLVLRRR